MQHLEVSGAVRPLKWSLGVKWLALFCLRVIKKRVRQLLGQNAEILNVTGFGTHNPPPPPVLKQLKNTLHQNSFKRGQLQWRRIFLRVKCNCVYYP
jgi:hypothetical protein